MLQRKLDRYFGGKRVIEQAKAAFRFEPSDDNYWNRGKAFAEGREAALQVLLVTANEPKMEIVKSEKVRGWYNGKPGPPEGTDTFFPPYVKTTFTSKRGLFVALLYPESERLGVKMPEVKRIAEGDLAGFVVGEDLILFRKSGQSIKHGEIETDGEMLYVTGEGAGRKFLVAGATYLSVGDKKRFTASVRISVALDADGSGAADGPRKGFTLTRHVGSRKVTDQARGRTALTALTQ